VISTKLNSERVFASPSEEPNRFALRDLNSPQRKGKSSPNQEPCRRCCSRRYQNHSSIVHPSKINLPHSPPKIRIHTTIYCSCLRLSIPAQIQTAHKLRNIHQPRSRVGRVHRKLCYFRERRTCGCAPSVALCAGIEKPFPLSKIPNCGILFI